MSLERSPRDGWLQTLVLITALSGGLWAYGRRAAPTPVPVAAAPTAVPVAATAAGPAGRKRPRDGREWIVDADGGPGADAETLAEAVAAASAGDIIRLRQGLHHGSVVLDKALTVIGDGKLGETVLAGSGPFALSARRGAAVTIENLTVSAPKGPTARAAEVREHATLRLVRGSYSGYDAEAAVVVERDGFLDAELAVFNAGHDTALVVRGRAHLKGGTLIGGKILASVFGGDGYLEANGVALQYADIGLSTGDRARAILTNCRFSNLKLEAIALSDSELKLIDSVFDRSSPACFSRGGRAECGTTTKKL